MKGGESGVLQGKRSEKKKHKRRIEEGKGSVRREKSKGRSAVRNRSKGKRRECKEIEEE